MRAKWQTPPKTIATILNGWQNYSVATLEASERNKMFQSPFSSMVVVQKYPPLSVCRKGCTWLQHESSIIRYWAGGCDAEYKSESLKRGSKMV